MNITVAGAGYVGLSNAILLAQNHKVIVHDITPEKVEQLNNRISPVIDSEIEDLIRTTSLLKDKASEITIKHSKGFVFTNFNFEIS